MMWKGRPIWRCPTQKSHFSIETDSDTALLLEILDVSQQRGFSDPSAFFALDKHTQILILAERRVRQRMQAVMDYDHMREMERKRKR